MVVDSLLNSSYFLSKNLLQIGNEINNKNKSTK